MKKILLPLFCLSASQSFAYDQLIHGQLNIVNHSPKPIFCHYTGQTANIIEPQGAKTFEASDEDISLTFTCENSSEFSEIQITRAGTQDDDQEVLCNNGKILWITDLEGTGGKFRQVDQGQECSITPNLDISYKLNLYWKG